MRQPATRASLHRFPTRPQTYRPAPKTAKHSQTIKAVNTSPISHWFKYPQGVRPQAEGAGTPPEFHAKIAPPRSAKSLTNSE